MLIFETFLKGKSDPNIHLNAPLIKNLGGTPPDPHKGMALRDMQF